MIFERKCILVAIPAATFCAFLVMRRDLVSWYMTATLSSSQGGNYTMPGEKGMSEAVQEQNHAMLDKSVSSEEEEEVDIYRDTLLRYAGYLNEVGEAFRPITSQKFVIASYVGAVTYVLAEAFDKSNKTEHLPENDDLAGCGIAALIDVLIFQLTASVIVPGFTINRWVALWKYLTVEKFEIANSLASSLGVAGPDVAFTKIGKIAITCNSIQEKIPTALGLALIPFIVKPIDGAVEKALDNVLRPALRKAFSDCALPFIESEEEER
eukprot:gnl/TRDRNA2_/TRDRNA2_208009_c0_seq1.p1 gnl/TRDRNA2_/TRDRNA2_208009_c0~~gnl/TRDRNA2_/TRDRNA2_208009_c0_seq1.p1  ORF type:complete len:267 (-),score=35.46 gnl/TRDRNA2_/TRDRNA2_208009_c0_seq1:24-824(-)